MGVGNFSYNYSITVSLWFDVGIKRYTTTQYSTLLSLCCGLM